MRYLMFDNVFAATAFAMHVRAFGISKICYNLRSLNYRNSGQNICKCFVEFCDMENFLPPNKRPRVLSFKEKTLWLIINGD